MNPSSPKGSLNINDIAKAFIVTILSSALAGIYQLIQANGVINAATIKTIGLTALSTGIGYIIKNYLSNSDGKFLGPEIGKS